MLDCDLRGAGVLITRPSHQATGLSALIESHHGVAVVFPALEILSPRDIHQPLTVLQQAKGIMIFVSPNAVSFAFKILGDRPLPQGLMLAAVGKGTANALAAAGYRVDLLPTQQYDSEGLLALPALQQVSGQQIVIVRGEGGRPLLGDGLRERGAQVVYAEVYRRACPEVDPTSLLNRWRREIKVVVATSNEVLINLQRMLGQSGWPLLQQTPLLVISERMRERAEALGFVSILLAENAGDQAILKCLCEKMR